MSRDVGDAKGRRVKSLAPSSPDPQSQESPSPPPKLIPPPTRLAADGAATCSTCVNSCSCIATSCMRCRGEFLRPSGRGRPRLYCQRCRAEVDREQRLASKQGSPTARCVGCGAPLRLAPDQAPRDRCLSCGPAPSTRAPRACEHCGAHTPSPRRRLCDPCREASQERRAARDRARSRPRKGGTDVS
jgi:hypothetical protein